MPNAVDLQQELLRVVRPQSSDTPLTGLASSLGQTSSPGADAGDNVADLSRELDSLRRQLVSAAETSRRQADILEQNTRAVLEQSARSSSSGAASTASDIVSSVRGGGGLFNSPIG